MLRPSKPVLSEDTSTYTEAEKEAMTSYQRQNLQEKLVRKWMVKRQRNASGALAPRNE